jgi:hypothetical protein
MSGLADFPGYDTGNIAPGYNPAYFGHPVYISTEEPELPQKGMLWYNPEIKVLRIYVPPSGWEAALGTGGLPPNFIAPVNTVPPVISGLPQRGGTLTVDNVGTWTGYPDQSSMTFTYLWKIGSMVLTGNTGSTFVIPLNAPIGSSVVCEVSASNGLTSLAPGVSNAIGPVDSVHVIPSASSVVLSGAAVVGSDLSATINGMAGYPTPVITYEWINASGASLSNSYRVTPGDVGKTLRVAVTLTNSKGSVTLQSNEIGPIQPALAAPTISSVGISGNPVVGQTLHAVPSGVTGFPTPAYTYTWINVAIPSTGSSYIPVPADAGNMIQVSVVATNSVGSSQPQLSPPVGPIDLPAELEPPRNIYNPELSGYPVVGSTLTSSNGIWSSITTPTYARQWFRNGVPIAGATSSTYVLTVADLGAVISCEVTASNANGSSAAVSAPTSVVVAASAPSNTVPPVITGSAEVDSVLSLATVGSWTGQPPQAGMTFTNQWLRNDVAIPGEVGPTYTLRNEDYGRIISCQVTANNGGSAIAVSNPIGPVTANTTLFINAVPFGFDVDEQPFAVDGIYRVVVGDTADDGTGDYEVTLVVSDGNNSVTVDPEVVFVTGDGTADGLMTFEGKLVDLNQALAGLIVSDATVSGTTTPIPFTETNQKDVVARVFDMTVTDVSPVGTLYYGSTVDGVIKFNGKPLTYGA